MSFTFYNGFESHSLRHYLGYPGSRAFLAGCELRGPEGNLRNFSSASYTLNVNDSNEALGNARRFADTSYADALSRSKKDLEYQLAVQRNQFSARGILRSGNMLHATAQLYGKHIDDMTLAKLEGLLEGYELHKIPLDEQLAASTVAEVANHMGALLVEAAQTVSDVDRGGIFTPEQFAEQVRIACKVSRNSVTVLADRRRLKPKEANAMNIIYQVSGYGRVNVNSNHGSGSGRGGAKEDLGAALCT